MRVTILLLILLCPVIAVAESTDYISYFCSESAEKGGGFKVFRNGKTVRIFMNDGLKKPVEIAAGTNSDKAIRLFALAEKNGFLHTVHDQGKCTISYYTPAKEHVVKISNKAPKPIKELFVATQAFRRSVAENKDEKSKL